MRGIALLQDHCFRCHNAEKPKGKFRIDNLPFTIADAATMERWRKVLNALNAGEMPPEDEKQLPAAAKADLLDDLAHVLAAARTGLAQQAETSLIRRLNRREYKNTLRELLGVEVNVSELSADSGTGGFDTARANLFMSSDQFEQYLSLGREALDEAFELQKHSKDRKQERFEAEVCVDRIRTSLKERLEWRRSYTLWTHAVDAAAARPENRKAAADIRESKEPSAVGFLPLMEKAIRHTGTHRVWLCRRRNGHTPRRRCVAADSLSHVLHGPAGVENGRVSHGR